jgi:3-phosphoshikimate 1-carboxyvinyltransferase
MLSSQGVPIAALGPAVGIDPTGWSGVMPPLDLDVPGDLSAAAFLLAATIATGSGPVVVRQVGVNPTRTGLLDVLRDMGVTYRVVPHGDAGGEPIADVLAEGGAIAGARVGGELLVRLIDEVPALVAVAATVDRTTEIRDAAELRVKESDRIAALASMLAAFGIASEELPDGLRFAGGARHAARVDSGKDHRIAMAAAVLGLATEGETVVEDTECVRTSFPGFAATLRALGADVEEAR